MIETFKPQECYGPIEHPPWCLMYADGLVICEKNLNLFFKCQLLSFKKV